MTDFSKSDNSYSDDKLIELIKTGNNLAFNQLFNRYWKSLYAYSFKVFKDHNLSEDAIQEVFGRLWEKRETVEIKNVKAYLFQAVKFQIAANIRRVRFTELHLQVLDKLNYVRDVEDRINYQELNNRLENALEELPDRCREIFHMSRFQNMSNQEIADRLNISKRTVENQISRGLQKLSQSLETAHLLIILLSVLI